MTPPDLFAFEKLPLSGVYGDYSLLEQSPVSGQSLKSGGQSIDQDGGKPLFLLGLLLVVERGLRIACACSRKGCWTQSGHLS